MNSKPRQWDAQLTLGDKENNTWHKVIKVEDIKEDNMIIMSMNVNQVVESLETAIWACENTAMQSDHADRALPILQEMLKQIKS